MSTRASIKVINSKKELWMYHHSDGYPEGVGVDLVNLLKRFNKEWTPENVIKFVCTLDDYFKPDDDIHGDIEYLYEINTDDKTLRCFERDFMIRDFDMAFETEVDIPNNKFKYRHENIFDEICDNEGNFTKNVKLADLRKLGLINTKNILLPKYKRQLKEYLENNTNLKYTAEVYELYYFDKMNTAKNNFSIDLK